MKLLVFALSVVIFINVSAQQTLVEYNTIVFRDITGDPLCETSQKNVFTFYTDSLITWKSQSTVAFNLSVSEIWSVGNIFFMYVNDSEGREYLLSYDENKTYIMLTPDTLVYDYIFYNAL